ncbi:hypothetical protein HDU85_005462 [Gaertneriomyces sp. JEL0708]|nr:hypothetical protein HDU85_005462 [Gaertneriomyces sp. JEL0708]
MMRRQGSDLSIAYSLGSHYNTPLREAMAVWEEDLAAAGRESSQPSLIGTSDDPPGASGAMPNKDIPMGYLRRVSLAPNSAGVPRVARTNLPVELPGRTYQPATLTEQLSSSPSLNCSIAGQSSYCRGSTTVLNQSFSESIGRSQRTFLDAGQADHKETCLDIVPTYGHTFNGLATSTPSKLKMALKSKHLRRLLWVGLTLVSLTAVAATVLLILDRTGRLSWETVKDRITSAAKSSGEENSNNNPDNARKHASPHLMRFKPAEDAGWATQGIMNLVE